MYTNYVFKPNYYFKGNGWTKLLKKKAMNDFMRIRSLWVDFVNPHYEDINNKWDKLYPDYKTITEEVEPFYMKFVAENLRPFEEDLNQRLFGIFKAATNPETGDFRLIFRFKPNMIVDYDLTPIKLN